MLSTNFPLLQVMMRKPPFLQGSRLPSPVSPLFQRKVSGMLTQAEKEAGEAQKESQAQVQVQSQQRQLRSALSKEQYKWNNAEI